MPSLAVRRAQFCSTAAADARRCGVLFSTVARDASDEEIKRKYRALAQTLHPDKQHGSAALREVRA